MFSSELNYYEIVGFITGLVCVYLNAKQNIWGWPVAMVSVIMYAILFYQEKLYGDMSLQVFFLILIIWGLYQWLKKSKSSESIQPTFSTQFQLIYSIAATAFLTGIIVGILSGIHDSSLPLLDALTTSISIIAQILLGKKSNQSNSNGCFW